MKASVLKAEVTVSSDIKAFAIVLAILEPLYSGTRERIIKQLVRYYGVTL